MANVTKAQIKAKLAQMYKVKEECISVYGLKTKFGGGRSTGFALIYDSLDMKKKYESKMLLRRVSAIFFVPPLELFIIIYQDGLLARQKSGRKQRKEIKGRVKKVRGIAKAKAAASGGKKKK